MKAVLLRIVGDPRTQRRFVCVVCAASFDSRAYLERHFAMSAPCKANRMSTRRADDRDNG